MEAHSHIKLSILFVVLLPTLALCSTRVGFYQTTCPRAEAIVESVVRSALRLNQKYAPAILQMFFHDCFVNGCDASILLDGPSSEKKAPTNSRVRVYEVLDAAKSMLETICPGVVSCADILALAARDSVVESGGTGWEVPTGRRDGLVSLASDAANMPGPKDSVDSQIRKFAGKGLNVKDPVTLTGGHTIGTAACSAIHERLYNYNHTNRSDPTIDRAFLPHLQNLCKRSGEDGRRVALDTDSENNFDNSYFENLRSGRGVLESDALLWSDMRTQRFVQQYTRSGKPHQSTFNKMFAIAVVKMSNIEVKTGDQGETRRVCNVIN